MSVNSLSSNLQISFSIHFIHLGSVPTLWGHSPHCGDTPHIVGTLPTLWGHSPQLKESSYDISGIETGEFVERVNIPLIGLAESIYRIAIQTEDNIGNENSEETEIYLRAWI